MKCEIPFYDFFLFTFFLFKKCGHSDQTVNFTTYFRKSGYSLVANKIKRS